MIKKRELGLTNEMITEVSLGAMNLRLLDTDEEGIAVIHKALDLGINLIDVARAYERERENGTTVVCEDLLRRAFESYKDIDETILIVTKGHGYDIEAFDEHLKISLLKLGVKGKHNLTIAGKKIKLIYFFHGITLERFNEMKSNGVLEHAKKLQNMGYFHYLGFSSHNGNEEAIEDAINSGYFQVMELPNNIFSTGLNYHIELAYKKGMGIINMKAFGGNGMVAASEIFKDYCDISPRERLQYCLANKYITTVDAGCRYVEELEADVAVAKEEKISDEECDKFVETAKRVSKVMNTTCRECSHCLEKFSCSEGLDFPKILGIHRRFKLAMEFNKDLSEIEKEYEEVKEEANNCISCGLCNEWCEYRLDIKELLLELRKEFN